MQIPVCVTGALVQSTRAVNPCSPDLLGKMLEQLIVYADNKLSQMPIAGTKKKQI